MFLGISVEDQFLSVHISSFIVSTVVLAGTKFLIPSEHVNNKCNDSFLRYVCFHRRWSLLLQDSLSQKLINGGADKNTKLECIIESKKFQSIDFSTQRRWPLRLTESSISWLLSFLALVVKRKLSNQSIDGFVFPLDHFLLWWNQLARIILPNTQIST